MVNAWLTSDMPASAIYRATFCTVTAEDYPLGLPVRSGKNPRISIKYYWPLAGDKLCTSIELD